LSKELSHYKIAFAAGADERFLRRKPTCKFDADVQKEVTHGVLRSSKAQQEIAIRQRCTGSGR
jgi:hypothetical protein